MTLPSFFTSASTGSQMNVAWMSPRCQAARTSGGRMLRICTSAGLILAWSSATIVWKCVVELNGIAIFLPLRSASVLMPGAVLRDQRLGRADVVEDPEELERLAARHRGRDAGGTDFADLHGARRHRLDHLAAAAELLPVDLVAGGLLELLRFLRDPVRHDHVLVADRDFLLRPRRRRGERREQHPCAQLVSCKPPSLVRMRMHRPGAGTPRAPRDGAASERRERPAQDVHDLVDVLLLGDQRRGDDRRSRRWP